MEKRKIFANVWKEKHIVLVGLSFVLLTSAIGYLLFVRADGTMQLQLKQNLANTAAIAAPLFDAASIDAIHGQEDMAKPAFHDLVKKLRTLRETMPNIRFAYIMRQTDDPMQVTFVADADSLASPEQLDVNHNGEVDDDEEASYPGDEYDAADVPALQNQAFLGPITDAEITKDQWGYLISGYAPIRSATGASVAVLGIDMQAEDYQELSRSIFTSGLLMLLIVLGTLLGLYVSFSIWRNQILAIREVENERSALLRLSSHQLGTPLSMFKWWIELFQDRSEISGKEKIEFFEQMQEGVKRMEDILKALHQAENIEAKNNKPIRSPVDIHQVLSGVEHDAKPIITQKKQVLHIHSAPGLPVIQTDETLLHAVLHELVDNASFYSQDGKAIVLSAAVKSKKLQFEVRDEGIGIPEEEITRIFEKFVRGKEASKFKPVGNGLGLYIAKGTIERLGGKMWIKSTYGKGTSIIFTLPI